MYAHMLDKIEDDGVDESSDLTERFNKIEEEMVPIALVENVLLKYGVDPELVDELIETIEAVDEKMGGDEE